MGLETHGFFLTEKTLVRNSMRKDIGLPIYRKRNGIPEKMGSSRHHQGLHILQGRRVIWGSHGRQLPARSVAKDHIVVLPYII